MSISGAGTIDRRPLRAGNGVICLVVSPQGEVGKTFPVPLKANTRPGAPRLALMQVFTPKTGASLLPHDAPPAFRKDSRNRKPSSEIHLPAEKVPTVITQQ
jgi:hypothetical protein